MNKLSVLINDSKNLVSQQQKLSLQSQYSNLNLLFLNSSDGIFDSKTLKCNTEYYNSNYLLNIYNGLYYCTTHYNNENVFYIHNIEECEKYLNYINSNINVFSIEDYSFYFKRKNYSKSKFKKNNDRQSRRFTFTDWRCSICLKEKCIKIQLGYIKHYALA